jgi:hypothetical protein
MGGVSVGIGKWSKPWGMEEPDSLGKAAPPGSTPSRSRAVNGGEGGRTGCCSLRVDAAGLLQDALGAARLSRRDVDHQQVNIPA